MRSIFIFVLFLMCAVAVPVYAVQVSLDGGSAPYGQLDTFYVPVRVDTQGECINALRVAVAYDPAEVSVEDVSIGRSIITLWTQRPTVVRDEQGSQVGRVVFEGGVPGGYCGRVEGDPGLTNIVAELVVRATPKPLAMDEVHTIRMIVEPSTRVYLHDGIGTEMEPLLLGAELKLVQREGASEDVWLADVQSDRIAPELFEITLVKGPSAGNSKHYIVFSTLDKQSGVDHFEVLETDPDRFGFLSWIPREAYWARVESPYILRDQHLRSKIMVKAVDKNGNERIAVYEPEISPLIELTRVTFLVPFLILLGIVIAGAVYLVHVRRKSRQQVRGATEISQTAESGPEGEHVAHD